MMTTSEIAHAMNLGMRVFTITATGQRVSLPGRYGGTDRYRACLDIDVTPHYADPARCLDVTAGELSLRDPDVIARLERLRDELRAAVTAGQHAVQSRIRREMAAIEYVANAK
jgi:hypothetical protein